MNILIITQDEIFYLPEHMLYLLDELPHHGINVVGTIILGQSPFGVKNSFFEKVVETNSIFGYKFFLYYSFKFAVRRLTGKTIKNVFKLKNIEIINLIHSINHRDSLSIIKSYKPDVIVSIAANQIFKKDLLSLPPKGCINLHTALLPKYRGLMPAFWALKNNEDKIGVSVFMMDEGIDSGPLLIQKEFRVPQDDTLEVVIQKTKKMGMDAIIEALEKLKNGTYEVYENKKEAATYYSFPTKEDVKGFLATGRKLF